MFIIPFILSLSILQEASQQPKLIINTCIGNSAVAQTKQLCAYFLISTINMGYCGQTSPHTSINHQLQYIVTYTQPRTCGTHNAQYLTQPCVALVTCCTHHFYANFETPCPCSAVLCKLMDFTRVQLNPNLLF